MQESITKSRLLAHLGGFIRVAPICSPRSGQPVRNQYEVRFENGSLFQSYGTLIGARVNGKLYLSEHHCYSTTTSKYCTEWCGMNPRERRKALSSGEIGYITD